MPTAEDLSAVLAGAVVDPAIFDLRPDYRVLLLAVAGIVPRLSDDDSEAQLVAAEASARALLAEVPAELVPHVASWREAYRAFGAKPQRTRNSLEALLRRAEDGLPRVNRLTDIYNAVSVQHLIPLGGEDLHRYVGAPRLAVATGSEQFDTVAGGESIVEHPEVGEGIWCDDAGVTCRRWNWRQARRTGLSDATTTTLFIMDALAPLTDAGLEAAGDDLLARVERLGPDVRSARRLIGAS